MAYQVETDSILAGSLNLLSPGERGGDTDALALHNWRVDQGGQLRTRLGTGVAVAAPGGNIHSIGRVERAAGAHRYYGSGISLYRDADPISIASGFDGQPLGMVSFQNRIWIMNRAKQGKDDGGFYYGWTPTKPAAAPTFTAGGASSGSLNGDYDYYVTFVTAAGEETNPSPVLHVTGLAANDSVLITRPATSDPSIGAWNVYRSGGAFPSQRYLVNVAALTILATTYGDNGQDNSGGGGDDQTDDGIASTGVILEVDHDPAPAAKTIAGPFLGRIFAFGTAAHPNRMFWTKADQPAFFSGSGTDAGGSWADIGEEGEEFIGAAVFPQVLLIIKTKSVWRLIGDPDDSSSQIERLNIDVGGIGIKAFAAAGASVYFQAAEGIYKTSVSSTHVTSPALWPVFKGDAVEGYGSIPAALSATRAANCMAYVNGRLYFSFATGAGTVPDTTLVYDELSQRWGSDSRGFSALHYEGQGGSLLGAFGGVVYPLEQGYQDALGAAVLATFQTRFRNQGQPNIQKHYANLEIQHRTNGGAFHVYAIYDNDGATKTLLGTITSGAASQWDTLTMPDYNSGEEPRSIAIRLEQTAGGTSYAEILTLTLRWYPVPLGGVIFDSGNLKLDGGAVCYLQNLELDIENTGGGTVSYEWQSDLPGNQVIQRAGANVAGAGIGSFRVALGVKEARWGRLLVRSTASGCRVRGARVQVRPIGLYLQGAGDAHHTADLNAGSPRLKLLSRIRVNAQMDGAQALTLLSDVPAGGNAIQQIAAGTIPATMDREWYELRLPSTSRAKLFRLVLGSATVGRVFEVLARVKVLGEAQSEWAWYPVPITPTPDEWRWLELPIA